MLALHNEVVRNRRRLGLRELMHFGDGAKQRLGIASLHSRSMRATCGMRFACPWEAGSRMTLFPRWGAWLSTGHYISNEANLRGLPPRHTFTRVANVDPLPVALEVAGAEIVSQYVFRAMGGDGHLVGPPVSPKFQVWEVTVRHI